MVETRSVSSRVCICTLYTIPSHYLMSYWSQVKYIPTERHPIGPKTRLTCGIIDGGSALGEQQSEQMHAHQHHVAGRVPRLRKVISAKL